MHIRAVATCPAGMPSGATRARVPPPQRHLPAARWDYVNVDAFREDHLPIDPRSWDRETVSLWARERGARSERFPMNGRALCLMTRPMFSDREPERGAAMYQDFRRRLSRALALQELMDKLKAASTTSKPN